MIIIIKMFKNNLLYIYFDRLKMKSNLFPRDSFWKRNSIKDPQEYDLLT